MTAIALCQPGMRRLILFGRYPVPGQTKTRLIPAIGPLGAAQLHRRLAEKSLATVLAPGRSMASVEFCYSGASRVQMHRWLGSRPVRFTPQKGLDLGERMRRAIFDAMDAGYRQVVLVGTDIPDMTADHLEAAFDALNHSDLVLGPSEDGGYWLVGLRCKANVFNGIAWGSAQVLLQTLAAARRQGLTVSCLTTLNDMDTHSDLKTGMPAHQWERPYLSVIIPTLNEQDHIENAIGSARSRDCEIIVSDGGSTDRTAELATACGVTVINAPRSRALQQNAGAALAAGNVLLFQHADTVLPAGYDQQVFHALMDRRVVAGAFQFKTDLDHWGMRIIEKAAHIRSKLLKMPYGDQALFLTKTVFDKIGGFPTTPIAEDLFLVRRLGRKGRIAITGQSVVTSGRRWRNVGIWHATLINYIIAIGCIAGVAPQKLAPLYRRRIKP